MESVNVISTSCLVVDSQSLQNGLEKWLSEAHQETALSVDFTNAHIVAARHTDENFRAQTANVDWFVPDSQVLTWAVKLRGGAASKRVYGPTFLSFSIKNGDPEIRHYFLGGNQECLDRLVTAVRKLQPNLQVAGYRNGYFNESEEAVIIENIKKSGADFVWVGLGTPKQQAFISQWKNELLGSAILAVGFAFDVNAGTKPDAPAFLGHLGLTWLYRLSKEPLRLWKRYLVYNSIFIYAFVQQMRRES